MSSLAGIYDAVLYRVNGDFPLYIPSSGYG
jgi:hypothetical protein